MPCTPNCGACCDPVRLPEEQALKIFGALEHNIGPQAGQLYDLWEPIRHLNDDTVLFRCAAYDVAARACTAYDDRPPVCRDFPFYGKPVGERDLPGESSKVCGYQAEMGRTVLPIVAVT